MKFFKNLVLPATAVLFALCSCDDKLSPDGPSPVDPVIDPVLDSIAATPFSATVFGGFSTPLTDDDFDGATVGILYTDNQDLAEELFASWLEGKKDSRLKNVRATLKGHAVEAKVSSLDQEKTYYYALYLAGKKRILGSKGNFTTLSFNPIVTTGDTSNVNYFDAIINGKVEEEQASLNVCQVGLAYHTSATDVVTNGKTIITKSYQSNSQLSEPLNLKFKTKYYYCAFVKTPAGKIYSGEVKSFETKDVAVDLGLSVMWSICNVGAKSPEEPGNYYAWGETQPKTSYTWDTYDLQSRYNTDTTSVYVSNKDYIGLADDAANVNWGGNWRMPTWKEFDELYYNCEIHNDTVNGIAGFVLESKINHNSIFIPASGYMRGSNVVLHGTIYSAFMRDLYYCNSAYGFYFGWLTNQEVQRPDFNRWDGLTIRPVRTR